MTARCELALGVLILVEQVWLHEIIEPFFERVEALADGSTATYVYLSKLGWLLWTVLPIVKLLQVIIKRHMLSVIVESFVAFL